ncbi:hypothetical protein KR100_07835 [Synechococcus sp. KORDI-100]|uniref:NAD(P)/FAD-dependent oxidoreductase n=1 Tax=Synechococcus sp. KORDI-100 TaxID=1280380 RepID=UPI0004E05FB9|nr:FAD-dependent oxidoreductase [Synechococcus sp. KORDI-100]AII43271.1 hypothetical protein KR100_07835 [Synechococcus sp. KORDI-100]
MQHRYDVVVVGGGTTGAAAAYHLSEAGVNNMLCLEMGRPGEGRTQPEQVPDETPLVASDESVYVPNFSGSRVFEGGPKGPRTIKMIATLPPYVMLDGFADLFGWDGVKTFLDLSQHGLKLQVDLANRYLPDPQQQIKQDGSLMVCEADQASRLKQEFEFLQKLDCPCEWWYEEQVIEVQGSAAGYVAGIWFPQHARIDSVTYAKVLLDAAVQSGSLTLKQECSPVVDVKDSEAGDHVVIQLADGELIQASQAIVATGGMYMDKLLAGILTPRYSYLAALPHRDPGPMGGMQAPNSANFFTLGFSHDWCVTDNFVRISGEDHYSGLKSPRAKQRCGRLAQWGWEKYPYLEFGADYPSTYGIYSETPDYMPLVGKPDSSSRVCYMVGCNAWGQASLSAAAALAPALLGYREMSELEQSTADLFSIRRFSARSTSPSL